MTRKIAVIGSLEATSQHGKATIEGNSDLLIVAFPNTKALATVLSYNTMKRLRSLGGASDYLGQDVVFSVGGNEWVRLKKGELKVKSPLRAALFYFSQWLKR
jgi:hypothetical protein